jgi:hypothetical protein
MKLFYSLFPLVLIPLVILLVSFSSGSPGGRSGSPGDSGSNCTACHLGTPQTATNWINSNIPASGYVAGETYTITASGTHSGVGKFGFELTAEDATGNKVGDFSITNTTETQLVNQNNAVTHTATGTTPAGDGKTWSMEWTAPDEPAGEVTFWAAFNAADGNGQNTGDVIYLTSSSVLPQVDVSVTFRVDMSNETISPMGVHIAGSFQGWDPGATQMEAPFIGNIYSITIDLPAGTEIEYKFINGNTWASVEPVAGPCTIGNDNNRFMTVPDNNVTLPPVCFGSCNICNPPQVDITFQVDMSNEDVSPLGVHIAGDFQNWNPAGTPMQEVGDDVYAVTFELGAGDYYEYKFINGNAWGMDETVPPECASGWNRFILVPGVSTTLDPVCFGSCNPCGPTPVDIEVTFQVDMSNEAISPDGVHIAGGFQGWDPGATPMNELGNGIYTFTTILPSGTYQEYKFVNGIDWIDSENVPPECGNNNNRFLTVPQNDTIVPMVCFGLCEPCPLPSEVMVTFQVDMSEQTVSPDGVHLALKGGDPLLNPMTDMGNGIWSVTLTFTENDSINFKYSNGTQSANYEQLPEECRVGNPFTGYWRYYNVPPFNTTIDPVCFASCNPCDPVAVTFRVDMSNEEISPDGVHLAGSFQGWNATSTPMSHTGDDIYEVTVLFAANQYNEFKYINGNDFAFAELVPEACGVDDTFGAFNRFFTVPEDDIELDLVCFGSCEPCVIPAEVDVTFQVDMSNETVSPDGVFVAGSFQGWSSDSTQMTLTGNNIYTYTATLIAGEYYEFKYLNGSDFANAEIVPGDCSSEDGNRFLTVPEGGIVLDPVCFGWCGDCPDLVEITFNVDMSLQDVSPDGVHLIGDFQNWDPQATPLTAIGDGIFSATVILPAGTYQTYRYLNGNSFETGTIENVPEECGVEDGFGGMKRFMDVPLESTTLDVVCFGYCGPCPEQHTISIPAGWSGLSSYLMPDNTDIEALLSEILPELVIIKTMTAFYYPEGGVNTIIDWESQSAYEIKVTDAVSLTITGFTEQNKTLQLNAGWNLIPVIGDTPVSVTDLFAAVADNLQVIKAVADVAVFLAGL